MQLDKMCRRLIIREPFWGLFLLGFNKRTTTLIPTMAVGKAGINTELLVNPEFWETLTDTQQEAILLHELHHVAFGHMMMGEYFPDRQRFNIAADAEVNCYIEGLPTDDGHVDVANFGLPAKKGSKYYYENLPEFDDGNGGSGDSQKAPNLSDDHSTWKDFSQLSTAEKELVKGQIDQMLVQTAQQVAKQKGNIPGHLKDYIDDLLKERPRIYNWKAQFRRMLGTNIETSFKKTYQRESKRFRNAPGIKFKRKVNILVAIDTSGSVSNEELAEFFSEIMHIYRAGAHIHVIECDTEITNEWDFTGFRDVKIDGRGGTEFSPVIDYYRDHLKEYNTLVFFTDGECGIEDLNVLNNNMTWVITSSGAQQDYPGKVIYIPSNNQNDK